MATYFNKRTRTDVIVNVTMSMEEIRADKDVVLLQDDNIFFQPLPDGKEIAYDSDGLPSHYVDSLVGEEAELAYFDSLDLAGKSFLIRHKRDYKIKEVAWRVERARDKLELGLAGEDLKTLLQYIEDLRNITEQPLFPNKVVWPVLDI